jgi:hypothetical protein
MSRTRLACDKSACIKVTFSIGSSNDRRFRRMTMTEMCKARVGALLPVVAIFKFLQIAKKMLQIWRINFQNASVIWYLQKTGTKLDRQYTVPLITF